MIPETYTSKDPKPDGLMSDEDFELFINNWPSETAAQFRAMPYPHDWNFVIASMAEWWVTLSPEANAMLARVFPPRPLCEHFDIRDSSPCEYCAAYPNCPVKKGASNA